VLRRPHAGHPRLPYGTEDSTWEPGGVGADGRVRPGDEGHGQEAASSAPTTTQAHSIRDPAPASAGVPPEDGIDTDPANHRADTRRSTSLSTLYTSIARKNGAARHSAFRRAARGRGDRHGAVLQVLLRGDKRFLPARFIRGECGGGTKTVRRLLRELREATYEPTALPEPETDDICGNTTTRGAVSVHYFVQLSKLPDFLPSGRGPGGLTAEIRTLHRSLAFRARCAIGTSRGDAPTSASKIPGGRTSTFYVCWTLPMGYLSRHRQVVKAPCRRVEEFVDPDADCDVVHFIGQGHRGILPHPVLAGQLHASAWSAGPGAT